MCESVQILKKKGIQRMIFFIDSLNYLPTLNISFFKPLSGCMNF